MIVRIRPASIADTAPLVPEPGAASLDDLKMGNFVVIQSQEAYSPTADAEIIVEEMVLEPQPMPQLVVADRHSRRKSRNDPTHPRNAFKRR